MQNTEYPLCWIEAHVGNPGKLMGLETYFGEAVPVLRTEKAPVLEKIKLGIPFKIKISYSKYKMKTEHEVITTGILRGMGWRARERTMKIRVTIPWLTSTYSVRLDDVMAGIGFLPTKRLKKEREENADAYLRETSTLYSHTKEDQAANLAEYTTKVRRVLDKLYEEEKEWEPVAVHA